MPSINKYVPAVPRTVLLILAGIVWECVGLILVSLAFSWLAPVSIIERYLSGGGGLVLALLIHHFGFLKIVDKNATRILKMRGKQYLFAFFSIKSYLLVVVMISIGVIVRNSVIPKKYLAVVYLGIGLALILSSIRYWRIFMGEMKKEKQHGGTGQTDVFINAI
jgi:hypothetical protein